MTSNESPQIAVLVGLSLIVVAFTAAVHVSDRQLFRQFLGKINPILASSVIVLVGGVLLVSLEARGWFVFYAAPGLERFLWPSGLVVLLAGMMILVDTKVVLPEDINAPFPQSLLFYPAVGYAAEILFHIVPLFLLLTAATVISPTLRFEAIIWPCIIIVSLIEPLFQSRPMIGKYPAWATAYVFLNVWVINVAGLMLFERYDFVSMYAFRLMYYLLWHIVWGYARLKLLF